MSEKRKRQTIGRYAGAASGGIAIVGPLVQELATDAIEVVLDEQARLRSTALRAAERSAGMTREEISDALVASPHLVPLVTRVLWLAGMNGHEEILEVLGGILGSIFLTPDDTEEAELILAGITDMKRVHLQVLRKLGEPPKARVKTEDSYDPVERYEAAVTDDGALPFRSPDQEGFVLQGADTWNAEALAHDRPISDAHSVGPGRLDERRIRAVPASLKRPGLPGLSGGHVGLGSNPTLAGPGLSASAFRVVVRLTLVQSRRRHSSGERAGHGLSGSE